MNDARLSCWNQPRPNPKVFLWFALLALACALPMAHAQQDSVLEEITVTAEKREADVQTVGLSISAFGGDFLETLGSRDVVELSRFVPNLQIGTETSDLKAMIRGVGSDNLEAFSDPGVAIHIDDVYQARPSGGNYLFYDMERVEVLRGPQGTLYGRNATGGVINFISKKPTEEFDAGLDLGVGENDWQRARGMINIPIVGDKLMFRAAGTFEERDGFQENLVPGGTEGNDMDDTSLRGQLLWRLTDKASFLLAGRLLDKGGVGPVRKRTTTPDITVVNPAPAPPIPANAPSPANCQDCSFIPDPLDLRTVYKDTPESFDLETSAYSLTFDYDFGPAVLTVIGADQSTDMDLIQDSDQSPIPNGMPGGTTDTAMVSQESDQTTVEVRLASAGDGAWEWLAGFFYLDEDAFQNTDINRDPTVGVDANINVLHDVNAESTAVFGQLSYMFGDSFKLTGGLRYTKDEKDAVGGTIVTLTFPPPFMAPPPIGAQDFTPEDDWSETTWKLGLDWFINDNNMLYGTVSTGYKAGGFNFGVMGAESYDPETVTAFEIGSKNRFFNDRMQFNASAFYYDYEDLQVFQVVNQTIVVRNAAEAEIYGAELEIVARPVDPLQIDASLGLLNTEYKEFILPSNIFLDLPWPIPTRQPTNVDVSGNNLINAPDWSGHIGVQYTFGLGGLGDLTARVQGYFTDDVYLRALNLDPYDIQDGYSTWDAKLMWQSPESRWYVEAFYYNFNDEDVINNQEVTDSGIYFANLNDPKRWGVVVGFRY